MSTKRIALATNMIFLLGCTSTHVNNSNIVSHQENTPEMIETAEAVEKVIPQEAKETIDPKPTEITETNTITEHRLDIPNYVQETGYYCVPACMQMVLDYHGIFVTQDTLANDLRTSSVTGTEYLDLARVANKYIFNNENEDPDGAGYHVQTIAYGDSAGSVYQTLEERIRQDISTNDPVFIAIDIQTIYPEFDWTANHMVVCTGYVIDNENNEILYYYIVDPSYLVQDEIYGGLKTVTPDTLYQAIYTNEEPAYVW